MQVFHHPSELRSGGRKVSLAIGMFDGVHLGHQQVILQAAADAEQHEGLAVAVTFDQHPNVIVAPARVPPLIYTQSQKLRALEALGIDATFIIQFDARFSRKAGAEFIADLARQLAPLHSITVGSAFTFGHQREGNVPLLKSLGAELNFVVHGIAAVALDGEAVSSTRIRQVIRAGSFDRATQMLGREYALCGEVIHGDRFGRTFGFPTANLDTPGRALPPAGVYAVHAYARGARHRAVANVGHRPTLATPAPALRVEAHLLDFEGDLYGQEMELTFVEKLRDEQRFPSIDELRAQIRKDIDAALNIF